MKTESQAGNQSCRILAFDKGKTVEDGAHNELLGKGWLI